MIIDKNGKIFGKINILDIIILLVVLVFILLGSKALFSGIISNQNNQKTTEVVYTLEVAKEDADFFDSIKEGDTVFKKNTKEPSGEVVSCDVKPAKYLTANLENLTYEITEAEDKFDGHVKIKVTADIDYPDLKVDGEALKIGKELAIRTENTVMNGYIIDLEYDKEMMGGLSNDN